MRQYLNPSQRRKSIKVWVSDEERSLIEAKAHNYCYRRLAPYIRDAAIYERVTNYKSMVKDVRHICKFATQISEENREELLRLMKAIYKMQIKIRDLITKKLDLEMCQEINRNKIK